MIDEPAPRGNRAEAEILRDGEILAERELLVHHPDAGGERVARPVEAHRLVRRRTACRRRACRCRRESFRACSCPRRSRRRAHDTNRRRSSSDTSLSACTPGNRFVMLLESDRRVSVMRRSLLRYFRYFGSHVGEAPRLELLAPVVEVRPSSPSRAPSESSVGTSFLKCSLSTIVRTPTSPQR